MLENLEGKRVALVGGAGFIGHNLALKLKKYGADVQIIDSLQVNNLLSLHCETNSQQERELYLDIINERLNLLREAEIPVHVEDARDYHRLSMLINSKIKAQVVIVLAAVAHASRSNKDPYHTFDHSFRTLENALDASKNNVEHFIYFSSSMVYGDFEDPQVTEESNCNPLGIYGALKYGGEKLVIAYNQVFNLPYTIVRPSALYGERCISRRVGQIFIENALRGQDLVIKGDGEDKLDFTYIDDLTEGLSHCIAYPGSRNQIFNLTYGESHSLNSMAKIIQEEFPNIKVNYIPRDNLMPERGTLNVDKARELVKYDPKHDLNSGYRKYIQWYKEVFDKRNHSNRVENAQSQINE